MKNEENVGKYSRKRAMTLVRLLVLLAVGLFATVPVRAQVPSTVSYQGKLTTPAGVPVADGVHSITFRIYDDSTAGNLFWEEVKSVTTKNGLFTVRLGETTPLDQGTLSIGNLFLAIKVGTDPDLSPRRPLTSVPYAAMVGTVEGATGGMIKGDLSSTGQVSGGSSTAPGGYFQTYDVGSGNKYGLVGKYMPSVAHQGSGVYGYSRPADTWGVGGEFEGGEAGVLGYVFPTGNISEGYFGIEGSVAAANPEQNARFYGVTGSASGARQNYGVSGSAQGSATSISCDYYGIYGNAFGTGLYSVNYGVYATAAGGENNYGIWAHGTTFAGAFDGDVVVTGNLSKAGGSFKIDHPLDPANKYLQHSFVESPDMMNIYNGNITLDANGTATVTMPDWFDALNRDFRYQLTAIGAPGPNLYVAEEVNNNHFSIAGGGAGMKVSWQVTGVRHDAWAEAHRIQVEVPKDPRQVGTYLHPELLGKPESLGESYEMTKQGEEASQQTARDRERMAAKRAAEVPNK